MNPQLVNAVNLPAMNAMNFPAAILQPSAAQLIKQYDGYRPFPDLALNGTLTVNENIADVAGLAVAYDAYRLAFDGKEAPTVAGFTGDQQFFLNLDAWYTAFGVKPGEALYLAPAERVRVW